jgi:hypothetical protein
VAPRRGPTARDCARALWLLGLTPPVDHDEVSTAWKQRVSRAHPDRHRGRGSREHAAETLTRALNDARDTLSWWIDQGLDWPDRRGTVVLDLFPRGEDDDPAWDASTDDEPQPDDRAQVDHGTGLRRGDRVRVWPYDGELDVVEGVERDVASREAWVRLREHDAVRASRVRLAAYSCPVCGACAGPAVPDPSLRPCPDCLVDLRRLEHDARDADRVRRAIEARATAGLAMAGHVGDRRLADRARDRRRWARRLVRAEPADLQAALLERFSRAYEAWGASVSPF